MKHCKLTPHRPTYPSVAPHPVPVQVGRNDPVCPTFWGGGAPRRGRVALLALWFACVCLFAITSPVRAQSQTVERWVDAIFGDDSRNCTRTIEEGEDGEPDTYIYNSCRTLARAVAVAGANDVIRVTGGTYNLPVTIAKPLTIIGGYLPGFGQQIEPPNFPNLQITTLNGSNLGTTVTIRGQALTLIDPSITGEPPMSVTLRDLRISGGNNSGLVIFSAGSSFPPTAPNRVNVTLNNVVVFGNSGTQGGGIRITGTGNRLTINGGAVQNNTATSAGGGIFVGSNALLGVSDKTVIAGNSAGAGNGGGIALSGALTVTLGGFTLTANSAANGGGLHVAGSVLELGSDSVVLGNSATNGGGIYIASGAPVLGSALIQQNNATNQGGGIFINGGSPLLSSLTVLTNTASSGGGVFVNAGSPQLAGLALVGNRAVGGNGGGLFLAGGNATLAGNAYTNNQATGGRGGGLYAAGGALTATGEAFTGNRAQIGGGAAFAGVPGATLNAPTFTENHASQLGGGLHAEGGGTLILNSPGFNGNTSDDRGAGLYLTNRTLTVLGTAQFLGNQASGQGGALFLAAGGVANFAGLELIANSAAAGGGIYRAAGAVTISGIASFLGNQATTGNGGALYLAGGGSAATLTALAAQNNEAVHGGVLFADNVTLTLGRVDLQSNTAGGNGGALHLNNATLTITDTATLIDNQAGQSGGAIYAAGSTLTLQRGGELRANRAEGATGGALYLRSPGSANLGALLLFENFAGTHGGGLYADGLSIALAAGSEIARNAAQGGSGGGFYVIGGALTLTGVQVTQNDAFLEGGGFYVNNSALTLQGGTTLQGNRAFVSRGGGGSVVQSPAVTLAKVTFSANSAETDGGALAVLTSTLTALQLAGPPPDGATFTNNTAKARGGALYVEGGTVTLHQVTLDGNRGAQGGGVYATTSAFTLRDSTLRQNVAETGAGGALYLQASSADFSANVLRQNRAALGAGLHLVNTPLARFAGDAWLDNLASERGGGLTLQNSRAELERVVLRGNRADLDGGALHALFSTVGITNSLVVRNQVGSLSAYAAGLYLGNSTLRGEHVTIADNSHVETQGVAAGVVAATPIAGSPPSSSISLRNSIVSGQDVGVDIAAGNSAVLEAVLWDNRGFDWTGAGAFSVAGSVRGNPAFLNAANGDYRIRRTSAAFDRGLPGLVFADRDGIPRPQGFAPDLGAHEHRYAAGLYLRATATHNGAAPFVRPGDALRISVQIRNQSGETARNVVLTANLPAQLPAPTMEPGQCQGIFCQAPLGDIPPGVEVTVMIDVGVAGEPSPGGLVTLNSNLTLATTNFSDSDTGGVVRAWLHDCRAETGGVLYPSVQAAVDAAPAGGTVRVSGVCGDLHRERGPGQLLTLDKPLTLEGGWNHDFTVFDPLAHPAILDAAEQGRVIFMDAPVAPTLAHLVLRGGNASGLGGGPAGKDAGGAVYLRRATPTLRQVEILTSYSPDVGGGVYIGSGTTTVPATDAAGPRFQGGGILSNRAGERGGGVYVDHAVPRFEGVGVSRNQARAGGGLYLHNSPARFSEPAPPGAAPTCRLDGNLATGVPRYVPGAAPVVWRTPGGGGGLATEGSALELRGCVVNGNQAMTGGGLYLHGALPDIATVENLWITNNLAMAGVLVGAGDVRSGDGGGVVVDNLNPARLLFRGNLLAHNDATRGAALLTRLAHAETLDLPHFTIHSNQGDGIVVALGESRLRFADAIIAFNQGGAVVAAVQGANGEIATIDMARTLWEPPSQQPADDEFLTLLDNFTGDPAFKNNGYHIKRISAGYGLGGSAAAFADRDGDPRPVGAARDLGADEYADPAVVRYVAVGGTGDAPCTDFRAPCPTLQLALDAAGDGDLIKMAGGVYSGVRNDDGRVHHARVVKNVTIQGGYYPRTDDNTVTEGIYTAHDWEDPHPDVNPTIIDVANQGRGLWIGAGAAPVIAAITIRRGNALALGDGPAGSSGGGGGGIYVDNAAPILREVVIQESNAVYGGGLYLRAAGGDYGGLLLTGNQATFGGGLYVDGGSPLVEGVTIQANRAVTGAGALVNGGAATLRGNLLLDNGDLATLEGGGLVVQGGAATIVNNTVRGNQALRGGGVFLHDSAALVRDNLIETNRAGSPQPQEGQEAALGGGLYVLGGSPLIEANRIRANQAIHPAVAYGGGVYGRTLGATAQPVRWLTNTVEGNSAHRGGGFYLAVRDGDADLQDNLVQDNRATATDNALRQMGGGVYLSADGSGVVLFTGNTVRANQAVLGAGLAVGGAGRHMVMGNTITANLAGQNGGGLYLDAANLTLAENTVTDNVAQTGRGGGLYATGGAAALVANTLRANRAGLEGGGVYLRDDATTLRDDLVRDNRAADGAGLYIQGPLPGAGAPAPRLEQVTLQANIASNHGGGLYLNATNARVTRSILLDNQAGADGGGAYIEGSTPEEFSANLIRNNQAGDRGGGLLLVRDSRGLYLSNAVVDNRAPGGGIAVVGAEIALVHTTLARNGVGLQVEPLGQVRGRAALTNTIIAGHTLGVMVQTQAEVALLATLWDGNATQNSGPGGFSNLEARSGAAAFAEDGVRLSLGSAAVGAGVRGDFSTGIDLDGEARFQGTGPELGADELTAACAVIINDNANQVFDVLQQAIDAAPAGAELRIAGTCREVVVRDGTPQVAYLAKPLTLRGGFRADAGAAGWQTPDPARFPAVLDARGAGRVVRVVDARVALEGLTLLNGDATGLGGGPQGEDAGGAVYARSGNFTLAHIDIAGGIAQVGGGLYWRSPTLGAGATVNISESSFRNNRARDQGGGAYLLQPVGNVRVQFNRIAGNAARDGAGFYVEGGEAILLANRWLRNQANPSDGRGGALYLANSTGPVNRNRVLDNSAALGGGFFVNGGAPSLTNNILTGNRAGQTGAALYLRDVGIDVRHQTLVDNRTTDPTGAAVAVDAPGREPILTNNILTDHARAVVALNGTTLLLRANLWHNNTVNWAGPGAVSVGAGNLQEPPGFIDAAAGNFRLAETSAAVDRGLNAGVSDDFDGQTRPARQGYDIGADEVQRASLNATLTALPPVVAAGEQLALVVQVINNGDVDINATIAVTLPAGLIPLAPAGWPNVTLVRGAVWTENLPVRVAPGASGVLNASLSVTSQEGAGAVAAASVTAASISGQVLDVRGEVQPSPVVPGRPVEVRLRVANRGAANLNTTIRAELPDELEAAFPPIWTPTIAGPDGFWSTTFTATVSATLDQDLAARIVVTSVQGVSGLVTFTIPLARPEVAVSRVAAPDPVRGGDLLVYQVNVTNTGNIPLDAAIRNLYPEQVALLDPADGAVWSVTLVPGATYQRRVTTTVEPGYIGPLAGSVRVETTADAGADAGDTVQSIAATLVPTVRARGGDWYDPASWEPPGVPPPSAVVEIPEGVTLFSLRPITVSGLLNLGLLELRSATESSQELTVLDLLHNLGEIRGASGASGGAAGLRINVQTGLLLNDGIIRAGDGAPAGGLLGGGSGGSLLIDARAAANNGILAAGDGGASLPGAENPQGGPGGEVVLTLSPGLFANRGSVVAGNGGASQSGAQPPVDGAAGGGITVISTAAARLPGGEFVAGSGGAGSSGSGANGTVVIGAPTITTGTVQFRPAAPTLIRGDTPTPNFIAVAPAGVRLSAGGSTEFPVRIINRGSQRDTYVLATLGTPDGWTVLNLPATAAVNAFSSSSTPVRLAVTRATTSAEESLVAPASFHRFTIVVASQSPAGGQVTLPVHIQVDLPASHLIRLPLIFR